MREYNSREVLSYRTKSIGLSIVWGLEQTQLSGARHGFGAAFHLQFGKDAQVMALDRAQREKKFLGDLLVGKSLRNQAQHFEFAFAQRLGQGLGYT